MDKRRNASLSMGLCVGRMSSRNVTSIQMTIRTVHWHGSVIMAGGNLILGINKGVANGPILPNMQDIILYVNYMLQPRAVIDEQTPTGRPQ